MSKLRKAEKTAYKTNMVQSLAQNQGTLMQCYFNERMALIKKVVEEVNEIMEEHQDRWKGMIKELGNNLAKKSLRHTDFANMINDLIEMQFNKEEEVRKILREFMKETEQITSKLENLLKGQDVKEFKRFIAKVQAQQRKKKIEIGKMIEQRLDDTQCNMQAFLEEFKNERVALNLEWEKLREGKERLGHINLLSKITP